MPYHQRLSKAQLRRVIRRAAPPKERTGRAQPMRQSMRKSVDDKPRMR